MKMPIAEREIEDCVKRLLAVLDKDIEHLEKNLSRLNELRSSVVRQDQDYLCQLLDYIRIEVKSQQHNDLQRHFIRKQLAFFLCCPAEDVTLTRIETTLPDPQKNELVERKNKLRSLTGALKKEFMATQLLLSDCQRFNRSLLKSIFESGQSQNVTYKPSGQSERQTDTVFMNLKF